MTAAHNLWHPLFHEICLDDRIARFPGVAIRESKSATVSGGSYMCKNIKFAPRCRILLVAERVRIRLPLDELLPRKLIQVFQTTVNIRLETRHT